MELKDIFLIQDFLQLELKRDLLQTRGCSFQCMLVLFRFFQLDGCCLFNINTTF